MSLYYNNTAARAAIEKLGFYPLDSAIYAKIAEWKSWYCGENRDFHFYKVYNGKKDIECRRKSLRMAQRVCEDWANLLLNEKATVSAGNETDTRLLQRVLCDNSFSVRGNRLCELAFALGTAAFVENVERGRVCIDYVRADSIFPLSMCGDEVVECAFCSHIRRGGKTLLYVQVHTRASDGGYLLRNALFEENGEQVPLPDGILSEVRSPVRLFQLISPNIVNKDELFSPFGASVFAGALDCLAGCDLVYDSFCNEFLLGRKRIFVPVSLARTLTDEAGETRPIFDPNDMAYIAMPDDQKLTEVDMHLRADEHIAALREQIDLLSERCGLGTHRFCVDASASVKTATEVVSENSVLYQNLSKHRKVFEKAVIELSRAVLCLLNRPHGKDTEISVDFDDSIIRDRASEKAEDRLDVSLG